MACTVVNVERLEHENESCVRSVHMYEVVQIVITLCTVRVHNKTDISTAHQ